MWHVFINNTHQDRYHSYQYKQNTYRENRPEKSSFLIFGVCTCLNLYVFVCFFVLLLYVFCIHCMNLAECVCIDAPSNFSCKKYKQIHTIQTNTRIIHTPILPTYIQKYIKNKSVTMCIYV